MARVPLHLIKLCVGCDSVEDLEAWRRDETARGRSPICHTRQTPKRSAECLEGGSLFWVMRGSVLCRQRILDIRTLGEGASSRCEIDLDAAILRTRPLARRPFQGWRYLPAADAPADQGASDATSDLPPTVALQLRELGAW